MRLLFAMIAGGIFGAGLHVSGMTNTLKVQGWLDFFGDWDPTLAFVLIGAILPMIVAWRIAERRKTSVYGGDIPAPRDPVLDVRLVGGAALFGIGWAMSGLCPGPAIASLSYGGLGGLGFFAAMAVGMRGAKALALTGADQMIVASDS